MIRWVYAFIDRPRADFDQGRVFWSTVTETSFSELRGDQGEFVTLLPKDGDPCLKVQAVDGAGGIHLDLACEDVEAEQARAEAIGATVETPHDGWTVMRSPAGLLFCLVPWYGEATRPDVVTAPDGSVSRADQVCVDVAPDLHDTEADFWAALTGWDRTAAALPEFARIAPPPDLPIRLLVQRLGEPRPTSAHLDVACADVASTRALHETLGATVVSSGPWWTTMHDPAGGTYCLTGRDPRTGTIPR
ncbi:VOC family protein [Yinghuangia seranimata]|uniref:VOC family protein n=1 Tax=Yinghuangia seranimata TaxID=408067 RepID=UPI00248B40AD|nr:VOC family protein [Yinghuangia seranimata]MDI2124613.1 VOC family protein [Yinghuangia seranimata]